MKAKDDDNDLALFAQTHGIENAAILTSNLWQDDKGTSSLFTRVTKYSTNEPRQKQTNSSVSMRVTKYSANERRNKPEMKAGFDF